eukprot:CAMPEP_0119530260 /NCGR_PEP_ID=MMETSP1344-20130328/44110_1 /TAXON_ID=236787 /ORGANISM="Florenciella parvula, Strain CCMP2471" /LENGTH=52 /DNA_ID=CAMNT_0007570127 /DNA_START=50 /DNA_END=204 /DNA_ORIENTATION=-
MEEPSEMDATDLTSTGGPANAGGSLSLSVRGGMGDGDGHDLGPSTVFSDTTG